MPFGFGNPPRATDIGNTVGSISNTSPYASSAAATDSLAALYGIGYGDRGYGQTAVTLPTGFATGGVVKAADWLNVQTAVAAMATFQGTSTTGMPTAAQIMSGQVVTGEFNWQTITATLDTNRLNNNGGASMSVTTGSLVITRATTWGASNGSITCVMKATFSSEQAARYFFNTGGTINIVLAHPSTSTTGNSQWNTILSNLGTIKIGAHATTRSGTGGTPESLGYYGLTTSLQTVFAGSNLGSSVYAADSVTISAEVASVSGVNGANGTTVQVQIVLANADSSGYASADTIALGTNASFGYSMAASSFLSNITAPTFTNVTNF
jgi:hypothetical protein